jgi:hypothetical protein
MRKGAEPSLFKRTAGLPAQPALRVVPADEQRSSAVDALVRRLAADRLRELRHDGVTPGYVARMYEVDVELLEQAIAELGSGPLD